jgi:uncharacterized protein YbjT (DUF2867 family)
VRRLLEAGAEVRVLSRHPRDLPAGATALTADLRDPHSLEAGLAGAATIVHCATDLRHDVAAGLRLLAAAVRAEVSHVVYISIVGVDRVPFAYYRAKLAVEGMVERSGLPWTILRATQFHELMELGLESQRRLPAIMVPALRFQPIAAEEVAGRLAELALGGPAGRVPDMAGPEVREARDLARAWLRATRRRRPVLPMRLPGRVFAAFRQGGHLAPDRAVGRITFEEHLAERAHPRGAAS